MRDALAPAYGRLTAPENLACDLLDEVTPHQGDHHDD